MNAKNMLKLLGKCAADARACCPNDSNGRSTYFLLALANELDLVAEPIAPVLRAIASPLTNADYLAAGAAAGSAA